jgi:carbonic anhydrase
LSQSPINLNPATIVVDDSLKYPTFSEKNGGCAQWTQFTDDHAFEVSFDETGNECENFHVTHDGEEYTLLQMHFHSPAEHTVGYGYNDAELHLVHKSDSGKYLVVGVFLDARKSSIEGSNNVFLNRFWAAAGVAGGSPANTKGTPYICLCDFFATHTSNTFDVCHDQTLIWPQARRMKLR